jgi:hypothetical protein
MSFVVVKLTGVIKIPLLFAAISSITEGFWANTATSKLKIIKQPRPQVDYKLYALSKYNSVNSFFHF